MYLDFIIKGVIFKSEATKKERNYKLVLNRLQGYTFKELSLNYNISIERARGIFNSFIEKLKTKEGLK